MPRVKHDLTTLLGLILLILGLILLARLALPQRPLPQGFDTQCVVTRIIDGDTIECDNVSIRLIGIDAPEIDFNTSMSPQAGYTSQQYLAQILNEQRTMVGLRFDNRLGDVYGRVLARIYLMDGTDIQQLMIISGHAIYRETY